MVFEKIASEQKGTNQNQGIALKLRGTRAPAPFPGDATGV